MSSQVTLLLICMLFSRAMSLKCQQCIATSRTCEEITCVDQCLTMTTSVYTNGVKGADVNIKTCGVPEMCVRGSMNLGMMKIVNNAKCCKTDLCNTETLPALPQQAPNGRMCYTCDANGCSGKMSCEGDEDRCISASVQQGSNSMSFKGCVSKSLCAGSASASVPGVGLTSVQCCEGNLCNGAESFTLSFLLMIIPLLSSILFY
ncbi:urokinase plasminogen activator surface receptor [Pangasianodon hypophthalmus]|uniref:urokinase plasminogen activator surface receptor n=1 Tax=Pangasianodon hypophthalmus TaxID=310915 RepID=UPI0023077929|nr:urokinase plasminogen activator surface receptor [Pangasianodon hypophthalmus]